ncbi:MAG: ATP synthase F0 subunit C [Chloroflexota bacterium]|nr:ATP synthase F0 subunit C [Chloroflexota bacterium]
MLFGVLLQETGGGVTDTGIKLIAAGLAIGLGALGPGIGLGIGTFGAVQAISRNPDAEGSIRTAMILGLGFAEAVAIYALVVALVIVFAGGA